METYSSVPDTKTDRLPDVYVWRYSVVIGVHGKLSKYRFFRLDNKKLNA